MVKVLFERIGTPVYNDTESRIIGYDNITQEIVEMTEEEWECLEPDFEVYRTIQRIA